MCRHDVQTHCWRANAASWYHATVPLRSFALRLAVIHVLLLGVAAAQQDQDAKPKQLPEAPAPKPQPKPHKHENPINETIGILGKRSIFFPDLATSPGPLRPSQKFELFTDKSIAPSRLVASAAGAGLGQAADTLHDYGQGMEGYGKRFATSLATASASDFFGTFFMPVMLHDDPRYFVSFGSGWHRFGYSLSRIVVTRTDSGRSRINLPGIIAPLLAESLAASYLPEKEQTTARTFRRYGIRIGLTAVSNLAKEYWPNIFRSLGLSKSRPSCIRERWQRRLRRRRSPELRRGGQRAIRGWQPDQPDALGSALRNGEARGKFTMNRGESARGNRAKYKIKRKLQNFEKYSAAARRSALCHLPGTPLGCIVLAPA